MLSFGKEERAKFEADWNNYSLLVQKNYDEARIYHDGKWIMFKSKDSSMFDDFSSLMSLKRKPNRME